MYSMDSTGISATAGWRRFFRRGLKEQAERQAEQPGEGRPWGECKSPNQSRLAGTNPLKAVPDRVGVPSSQSKKPRSSSCRRDLAA